MITHTENSQQKFVHKTQETFYVPANSPIARISDLWCETLYTLLYLYRARSKITQLSIPTHAQLQRHRLKFIKTI